MAATPVLQACLKGGLPSSCRKGADFLRRDPCGGGFTLCVSFSDGFTSLTIQTVTRYSSIPESSLQSHAMTQMGWTAGVDEPPRMIAGTQRPDRLKTVTWCRTFIQTPVGKMVDRGDHSTG